MPSATTSSASWSRSRCVSNVPRNALLRKKYSVSTWNLCRFRPTDQPRNSLQVDPMDTNIKNRLEHGQVRQFTSIGTFRTVHTNVQPISYRCGFCAGQQQTISQFFNYISP